jgi:hypothetical protein
MSRPIVTNHNLETNEIEVREMNDAEFAQWEIDKAFFAAKQAVEDEDIQTKQAAQAKLAALGLTTDDLKALGL